MKTLLSAVLGIAAMTVIGCAKSDQQRDAGHHADGHSAGGHHTHDGVRKQDLPVDQVPAPVRAGLDKAYPGATVSKAEKETYGDGTVHYEFHLQDKAGKKHEVEFNADGEKLDAH